MNFLKKVSYNNVSFYQNNNKACIRGSSSGEWLLLTVNPWTVRPSVLPMAKRKWHQRWERGGGTAFSLSLPFSSSLLGMYLQAWAKPSLKYDQYLNPQDIILKIGTVLLPYNINFSKASNKLNFRTTFIFSIIWTILRIRDLISV